MKPISIVICLGRSSRLAPKAPGSSAQRAAKRSIHYLATTLDSSGNSNSRWTPSKRLRTLGNWNKFEWRKLRCSSRSRDRTRPKRIAFRGNCQTTCSTRGQSRDRTWRIWPLRPPPSTLRCQGLHSRTRLSATAIILRIET